MYEPTVPDLLLKVFLVGILFVVQAAATMTLNYIQELHASLTTTNTENLKLMNGMHEGLLILQKKQEGTD